MDLQISEQQTLLLDMFAKLFAKESTPERVRACEPLGFDGALWQTLVDVGAPLLRVPEDAGGAGVGLLDAALIAEEAGKHLASAPLIEALVAAAIIGNIGGEAANSWIERIGNGALVTLALREAQAGVAQIVPGGAVADGVLFLAGDKVYLSELAAKPAQAANQGALPLAKMVLPGAGNQCIKIAEGAAARDAFLAGIEEWKLLTAACLTGITRKAMEDAAAYSCEREAFDRVIGSYQGLAHPMADSITDVDGARLLVWWTVCAIGNGAQDAAALVSMAYWWATQATTSATIRAMRVFGGYGVSMEYPVQTHFRRGRALSLLLGDPKEELRRAADRLFDAKTAVPLPAAGEVGIDFGYGAEAERHAANVRRFFEENLTAQQKAFTYTTEDGYDPAIHRQLAQAGLLFGDWPPQHGGKGRSPYEISAQYRVFGEYNWLMTVPNCTDMVSKMVLHFGSEAAKQEILPKAIAGEVNCALGYSEPSCGSDIFAAKTRAVKDGDDWIINGQKMFTSQGHLAQYALMVTRTDPNAKKHAGITLFLLPLDQPGYECTEVKTLGGERTNVTFYADMRVPDKYRLGEVNGGAKVLAAVLTLEQSGGDFYLIPLARMFRDGCEWARATTIAGRPALENDDVRLALARTRVCGEVQDILTRRAIWGQVTRRSERYFGPMSKLFGSEASISCSNDLMNLAAPASLLQEDSPLGWIEVENRRSIAGTIYAGSSEVQRSIIAETALNMPRTRS